MILILSTELDHTTDLVIDWIYYLGGKCLRVNGEDFTGRGQKLTITIQKSIDLQINNQISTLENVNVIWSRRWHMFLDMNETFRRAIQSTDENVYRILTYLKNEFAAISPIFYTDMGNTTWLDHPKYQRLNKIEVLLKAKSAGLNVPDSMITNNFGDLRDFCKSHVRVVSKPISNLDRFMIDNRLYSPYTLEVTPEKLNEITSEFFFPSLVQEYIEKEIEIRVFYCNEVCRTMAIFSQANEKTKIDFRHYDFEHSNRMVPYIIPRVIENQIHTLMNELNLKHGSIDLIKAPDGLYYFLEVNPVGQFGMVSYPCNYYLEKDLAKTLISYDR